MIKSPQTIFTGVPRGGGAEVCIDGIPFEYIVIQCNGKYNGDAKKTMEGSEFCLV